ncbi:MAG: HupE/UreJ family protein [Acidobacteria bacterium]|nr:MAG: HupE/UreJ family protein [Acidobacteriota bacterium]REK03187.1 MAG: HupE/UreJ family protein [Acidobacteriota bacterium]
MRGVRTRQSERRERLGRDGGPGCEGLRRAVFALLFAALLLGALPVLGHGVAERDEQFLAANSGFAPVVFVYLGAKHMVTGYDHLLFLAGVIFFLYRFADVALYVTLFAVGHSITLLLGVLADLHVDVYLIDAIIGFSVVYKAFENLGGMRALGLRWDTRVATLVFGLFHGLGLATKLQEVALAEEGLVGNMLSFNLGVELGQLTALTAILVVFAAWRASGRFERHAAMTNWLLMVAGFVLMGVQIAGYFVA